MNIAFVDLKRMHQPLYEELEAAFRSVMEKGDFVLGKGVGEFEAAFAAYCGSAAACGVASGIDAIELALNAAGVGKGDGVIVPVNTFISTALAVVYRGAVPVFVDCEERSYTLDVSKIEAAIKNSKAPVKAVIPVHLYGQPCDMKPLMALCKTYNLKIIEDACQSHGATVLVDGKWAKAGSLGDAGCFSFYPGKNLGGFGDGGMITTNSAKMDADIRVLRDLGQNGKYNHEVIGYNSRLDTVQAAVLAIKLKHLDEWNASRREAATMYAEELKSVDCVLPTEESHAHHVWHLYVIRVKNREELKKFLTEKGVGVGIHYPFPLHITPAMKYLGYKAGDFPVAEKTAPEILSLPMFPYMKREEIKYVADCIREFQKTCQSR